MSTDIKPKVAGWYASRGILCSRGRQVRCDVRTWREHQATARREARPKMLPMSGSAARSGDSFGHAE